jgi:WD40 repeat protein
VQFNKEGRLVLAAGSDGNVRLSQIDAEDSNATRVQTVSLPNCEISQAAFMPNGSEIIVTDGTEFVYSCDLMNNALSKGGPFPKWEEDRRFHNFEVSPDSSTVALVGNNRGYILLI